MPPLLLNTTIPFRRAYKRICYQNNMSQEFVLQYWNIWSLIWKFQMYCYSLAHIQVDQNHMVHAYKYVMFHDINIEVFHLKFFCIHTTIIQVIWLGLFFLLLTFYLIYDYADIPNLHLSANPLLLNMNILDHEEFKNRFNLQ